MEKLYLNIIKKFNVQRAEIQRVDFKSVENAEKMQKAYSFYK